MLTPFPPIRRVVTGTDANGHSYIEMDGPSPATTTVAARPGYRNANIWRTNAETDAIADADDILQHQGVLPPGGGSVIRVIDFPPLPQDPAERERQAKATFDTVFPDARHQPDNKRHAGMHITATVDYAIVLQGEITAILDKEETVLRNGDILVQRGTNHAWANRTNAMTRVAFILVDAPQTRAGAGAR